MPSSKIRRDETVTAEQLEHAREVLAAEAEKIAHVKSRLGDAAKVSRQTTPLLERMNSGALDVSVDGRSALIEEATEPKKATRRK